MSLPIDVARRAGVSQPTVSRALRNLPGTSPATGERVLRAAAELAYIPSDSARSLSSACCPRHARGIAVPERLTVVGFDDLPMAGWPLVNHTTVRCDLGALASAAVELLLDELRSPGEPPVERRVSAALTLRGTHGRVPR